MNATAALTAALGAVAGVSAPPKENLVSKLTSFGPASPDTSVKGSFKPAEAEEKNISKSDSAADADQNNAQLAHRKAALASVLSDIAGVPIAAEVKPPNAPLPAMQEGDEEEEEEEEEEGTNEQASAVPHGADDPSQPNSKLQPLSVVSEPTKGSKVPREEAMPAAGTKDLDIHWGTPSNIIAMSQLILEFLSLLAISFRGVCVLLLCLYVLFRLVFLQGDC